MRILVVLALLVTATGCQAATFTLTGSYPGSVNNVTKGGTCALPLLEPAPFGDITMHARWLGPETVGEDSLSGQPTAAWSMTRTVPAGLYDFRVWFSNTFGSVCDTTFTFLAKGSPPWKRTVTIR